MGFWWDRGERIGPMDTAFYKVAGSVPRRAFSTLHHEGDAVSAGLAGDRGAGLSDK